MESIQPYLDYFSANPGWALVVIFLIAFGEALLIIGLFVPSTAVLVGAGMLVGTGHLDFWSVFWATAAGCILGDQVSYWAGRMFGDRLKQFWPLNKYQSLVLRGEDFVRNHGGKSIAFGRFVPGVKAVVPGIVGMLGMSQPYFIVVNVVSGLVWAAAHVLPGVLLGHGLAAAGDVSGRLVLVLLILLVFLGIVGWVVRLLAAGFLSPVMQRLLLRISTRLMAAGSRPFHRLGRRMAPGHPQSSRLLSFGLLAFVSLVLLTNLVFGVWHRETPSNLDLSMRTLMLELRNAPADDLMVALTMLGDGWVLFVMCAGMAAWLAWRKAWPVVAGLALAVAAQIVLTLVMKWAVARPRPPGLDPSAIDTIGSFPSAYAGFAALAFGMLAVIAGHAMGRWSRASLISVCCVVIAAISYSRVYLGAHWLSDVLGGIMLAIIPLAAIAFLIEAYPVRRLRPLGLIAAALFCLVVAWSVDIQTSHDTRANRYAKVSPVEEFSLAQWTETGWKQQPAQRIDLAGQPEEAFVAQWVGSLESLKAAAESAGFKPLAPWSWRAALAYFNPSAAFDAVPPRPYLHEGLRAKLTALREVPGNPQQRTILRAYRSTATVNVGNGAVPVFFISIRREQNDPQLDLFTMPLSLPESPAIAQEVLGKLSAQGQELPPKSSGTDPSSPAIIIAYP